ncbi:restriction endonuclease subunit S [Desulfosporosinus youngiae]|uniref:Restriction endonuclease S subunit n=1 Tax=Desulfosporosinus youngiae DSM 17734 TaxID=768710 RepID=H5Y0S5_9FIRM|nr:restriction endonuclease subunit S [Desulfosporosinus youngiae]EHQ92331.1 restriction endonuclease S subunit [Desulfosporosinus youngiae DSM 17734]
MGKWVKVKLVDICDLNMGQSPESSSYNQDGDGIPFYQGNADFGELNPETRYFCNKPTKIAQKNDILLSVRAPIGALNIAMKTCCIGRGLAAITARENISDAKFLYYVLKMKHAELNQKGTGSTFKAINKQNLSEVLCPLPPLEIQRQIAKTLDTAAEIIGMRKKQLAELDNLIKSTFNDMFGDPVMNEKGWDKVSILDVCSEIVDCVNKTAPIIDGVSPYKMLRTTNIKQGKIDTKNCNYVDEQTFRKWTRRSIPRRGDVLLTREAPIGETGIIESDENLFLGQRIVSYRVNDSIILPLYLLNLMQTEYFQYQIRKLARGSTVKHLSVPECNLFEVYTPPHNLQTQFATILTKIEEQKALVKKAIDEAQLLFDSLMSEYFE